MPSRSIQTITQVSDDVTLDSPFLSLIHSLLGALVIPQQEKTIHMILIGRAGSGKTCLGNAILGERQFDLSVSTHSAIGEKCKVGFRYFHPQKAKLIVIDTPGFFNNEDDVQQSVRVAFSDGSCAILLLLSIEFGLTNQEEKMLDTLTNMYGETISHHIIVVFTGLDKIEGELQTFISEQCSSSLKHFLARCGHRYMGIKNNYDQPNDKDEFVSNLIHVIDTMPRLSSNHLA